MYEETQYEKYYDNCGESKDWIYPTMTIVINHDNEKKPSQNHYGFLRTSKGYKLINLVVRNQKLIGS